MIKQYDIILLHAPRPKGDLGDEAIPLLLCTSKPVIIKSVAHAYTYSLGVIALQRIALAG